MAMVLQPWQLLVAAMAGWINQHQQAVVEYLREENRVLKEQLGGLRLRLTDAQRLRLARTTVANILKRRGIEPAPAVVDPTLQASSKRQDPVSLPEL